MTEIGALRRMDEAAKKATLGGIKIKDLINEGRKYLPKWPDWHRAATART